MAAVSQAQDFMTHPSQFKTPVATSPPMTEYNKEYLDRKREVGEKIFKLKSGRQLAYFTEGSPSDGPAVLCVHGLGQTKYLWLEPKPIPGVFRICIDRMGHGSSSTLEGVYKFNVGVPEVAELLDSLGIETFFVVGHSMGGAWALQIAAALGPRVLGCADISGMCDIYHKDAPKEARRSAPKYGKGCSGKAFRCLIRSVAEYFPDKTKDFGMAAKYKGTCKGEDGGDKRSWDAMDKNPFFVTKTLDSYLHGTRSKDTFDLEFQRMLGLPYDYDTTAIQCPTFIYNGKKEATSAMMAEGNFALIKGAELIIMPEHGHSSILLEAEKIILALVQGKSVVEDRWTVKRTD